MRILCVGQVENDNYLKQIQKQTIKPHHIAFYLDKEPAKGIDKRRERIAFNHQYLVNAVKNYAPDLVWQIEGDVELPENALEKLLEDYEKLKDDDLAYVSGIQVGRHGVYCLGAWHVKEDEFYSADFKAKGLQEVDATGFYCLLAPADKWLEGIAKWNGEPYGPDVVWGLSITGKKYIDMDLEIGHKIKGGVIRPSDISTCNVSYKKIDNKWHFKQLT